VYVILQFSTAFLFWLVFTVDGVYQITVVKLNPLQLVLVGTILEATTFLFEIPTGVLADVKSRRLSVIIGYVIMGLGFVVEGSFPFFSMVACAQVMWGLGYTFTSGATQAWMVDELGEECSGEAFLRGAQATRLGELVVIPFAMWLGSSNVAVPVIAGGVGMILLALFLVLCMPENGFHPRADGERSTWKSMVQTIRDGRELTRRQPILLSILGIGLFYGLYSEGLDRLWTVHFLQDFAMPWLAILQPVVWFGIIRAVQQVISIIATEIVRRRLRIALPLAIARMTALNAALIVVALAAFALTRSFWVALLLYCAVSVLRNINGPLHEAWLNQHIDDPHVRATVFSLGSQVDALGQIGGGPLVGLIGQLFSVRAALVTSALMLSPALPLYARAPRRSAQTSSPGDTPPGTKI